MDANGALLSKRRWQQRLSRPWQRLKKEGRDFLELFLVPSVAVWLPWPTAYRLFRWVVENTSLYSRQMPRCLVNARHFLGEFDETGFAQRQKMLRLLDQADFWLIRFRPAKAMAITQVENGGHWLGSPGFLALCNHWGAGFLGIHHLKQQGHTPLIVFLETPLSVRQHGLCHVLAQTSRRRYYHRLSGGQALTVKPGESRAAGTRRLLTTSKSPLLMVDTPSSKSINSLNLRVGDKTWCYPADTGYIRLITKRGRDFVEFSVAFDYPSGQRRLRLRPGLGRDQNRQALLRRFQDSLNQRLAEDPAQWQFWHVADTLLQAEKENPAP